MICYTCGDKHGWDDECTGTFSGKTCPSCREVEIPDEREICYACETNKPKCDNCNSPGANPCVKEQYIQYEEGGAGFDAPVRVGNLCEPCREEEEADLESEWTN